MCQLILGHDNPFRLSTFDFRLLNNPEGVT